MSVQHPDPRIDAAIRHAWTTHPWYAPAIGRLRIVADRNVPTMATSKHWVTHYNPDVVRRDWTTAETAAVLVHELEHLLRQHDERCGDRDPQQWNIAADAEINQRLPGLPDGAVYPEALGMPRGGTAESYYNGSARQPQPQSGGDGEGSGEGDGQSGSAPGQPGTGQPQCGSAAGGPVQPHESGDAANPGSGAMDDGESTRRDVAESVLGAAGQPGTEEGTELREWAEREIGIDRNAWYGALAGIIGRSVAPHGAPTRWQWPGRRDPRDMGGAMVPRWTGERPACAIVIDTSGSVTPFDLDLARAAAHFIGRMADVTLYTCTTRARRLDGMPDHLVGGGGTDMTAGIEMAIADGAAAVVVITDCETPWPKSPTHVPVIVAANLGARAIVGPDATRRHWAPPDWMTIIPIVGDSVVAH